MKFNYIVLKSFLRNKRVYPTLLIVLLDLLVLGVGIFYGLRIYTTYNEMLAAEDEVQKMKSTITLIRNNQSVFDDEVEVYNEILTELIPDQESYFSVISTLEQISERTGVIINSYSVNLSSTTEEKLTLSVSIKGNEETLQKFLQEYRYTGGRLLTTESLDIDPEQLEDITVSLNFYHNEFRDTVSSDSRVKLEDLQLLDEIKEQL